MERERMRKQLKGGGRVPCVCVCTGTTRRERRRENYTADLAGDTCVTGGLTKSSRSQSLVG